MSFYYLASPYTDDNPGVQVKRYYDAMHCLHWLLEKRVYAYSPIVHCHPMAEKFGLPSDNSFWQKYNRSMIDSSVGLFVLKVDGWENSIGVADELGYATKLEREILYITPIKDDYLME